MPVVMIQNERNLYSFTDSEGGVDTVGSGLIGFFIFFFCLYWEPPGSSFSINGGSTYLFLLT